MRSLVLCVSALVLAPIAARAEVEITVMLGYREGGAAFGVEAEVPSIDCLLPPCVAATARTPDSDVLSLVVDVPIRAGWMFEALVQRLDGSLGLTATPEIGRVPLSPESFELTTAQVGLQRAWGAGSWQPFVAAGVGVGRVESSARLLSRPIVPGASGERFAGHEVPAASVAGGAKMSLGRRLGLRLEARGHWIDLRRELGGERFQGEVSVGLTGRL